jgi:acyl-CoA synthetase (AMP-forming)/AMP-acid ligase II
MQSLAWLQIPCFCNLLYCRQHMPQPQAGGDGPTLLCYEQLLDQALLHAGGFSWPPLDENSPAGLCYTSGTTGKPKGVRYTHRSNFLHALIVTQPVGGNWVHEVLEGPGQCQLSSA